MTSEQFVTAVIRWCDAHRKATAVIVAIVVGVVIGAIVF